MSELLLARRRASRLNRSGSAPLQETPKRDQRPYNIVMEAGRIGQFAGHVLSDAVRRPRGYWKSVRDESYLLVKLCWWPMVMLDVAFGFGAPASKRERVRAPRYSDRLGSFFVLASVREFGPFVTAMW